MQFDEHCTCLGTTDVYGNVLIGSDGRWGRGNGEGGRVRENGEGGMMDGFDVFGVHSINR